MSAFDELYVRFLRAAIAATLASADERARGGDEYSAYDAEYWSGEARAWGRAARAVAVYMSPFHVKQLEGAVMKGKFTLNVDGVIEVRDAAAAK